MSQIEALHLRRQRPAPVVVPGAGEICERRRSPALKASNSREPSSAEICPCSTIFKIRSLSSVVVIVTVSWSLAWERAQSAGSARRAHVDVKPHVMKQ